MRIKSHVEHISSAMVQTESEGSTIMEKEVKLRLVRLHHCKLHNDGGFMGLDCELKHSEVKFKYVERL